MAAVVDRDDGRLLETKDFSTTRAGYRALLRWMRQHGALESVGIEGTGSYGAGIMRFLNAAGVTTHEVDRPDRSDRRRRGKSDAVDGEMAARAVISGRRLSTPKNKNGRVEALRGLRLTRAGAVRSRTKALQLLRSHAVSAPDEVCDEVRFTTLSLWQRLHGLQGRWDADAFEAMVRVVHFFSLLIARWSRPHIHVSWVTDQDAIVANDALPGRCGARRGAGGRRWRRPGWVRP